MIELDIITLSGKLHAGRVGESLLSTLDLKELVAKTTDEYTAIAAGLARNPNRVAEYRYILRKRMLSSPLSDGQAFAEKMEEAYRMVWRRYCQSNTL